MESLITEGVEVVVKSTFEKEFSKNYFPFGAGPRMCIGNNFAMYEMILAIIALIEQFEIIEKESPIQIKPLITLKPHNAILEFKNRI